MAKLTLTISLRRKLLFLALTGLTVAAWGRLAPATPAAHAQEAPAATFTNTTPLNIADADVGGPGIASAYPSTITVSGLSGTVTDVNVTLNGLTHTWPDDIAVLLVGPAGQNIVLQSDVGAGNDVSNITYTIDDQAASIMPDSGMLASGSFRATSVLNDEIFPTYSATVAPPTTYSQSTPAGTATLNGVFNGTAPNGAWKLYVIDQFTGDSGGFSGGWTLNVTTSAGNAPSPISNPKSQISNSEISNPAAPTVSFSSTTPITLTDATAYASGQANPYPSTIAVTGLGGTVTDVNVTLRNVTHPVPDDLGLMLVGPDGRHVILQTDAGGSTPLNNVTYTFDDEAAAGIANSGPLVAGSYRPTSVTDDDHFPPITGIGVLPYKHPAPVGTSTLNGIFTGATPNGDWKLFAIDQFTGDAGIINGGWTLDVTTTSAPTATVQFGAATYETSETNGVATLSVTRTGDTSVAASVAYATQDNLAFTACNAATTAADQRCDYIAARGVFDFAAGETSKSFVVPIIDDTYTESMERITVSLSGVAGGVLGSIATTTINIADNDPAASTVQPLETARFFVKEQYFDFLSREPDTAGWDYWTGQITDCRTDASCTRQRRVDVSNAFFFELEFQQTGAFVYRLYRAAYGNTQPTPNSETATLPAYSAFVDDRARLIGGATLATAQLALSNAFVQRAAFTTRYPASMTSAQFVDAVLANINTSSGADLTSQRTALISLADASGRGAAMYRLADDNASNPIANSAFLNAEYNKAFVLTQYFGYLRRDTDLAGFNFWLGIVNRFPLRSATGQNAMVCAFITSTEYQQRFNANATRSNSECPAVP